MNPSAQVSAGAARDAYNDRSASDVDNKAKTVYLGDKAFTVLGYEADSSTGFHATAYRSVDVPHNIIIAYRGTDPDFLHHTRTTGQDAAVDFQMVRDRVNPQKADAGAFTAEMIRKAEAHGIPLDQITVAGHSLGGTLAEIEAWEFKLHGATFNAYGAVGLGYGVRRAVAKSSTM